MNNKGPKYSEYSWIWWSVIAIIVTAAITVAIIGGTTGNWPWNRGSAANGGSSENTTGAIIPENTNGSEETTLPEETETQTATKPEDEPTESTVPETTGATESTEPTVKPTDPTKPTEPEETQPEETQPEVTEPTTKPTEPEEDEGGGEKPQPGDIDVPIGPRP